MPACVGVNFRVTSHLRQGGRKYMEDFCSVVFERGDDGEYEFAFLGIFDGHGGAEAAAYAKEHLMKLIVQQKNFWSDNDEDVLKAIKEGYIATHYAMWKEQAKWPKTASGRLSFVGTTASIAFIRHRKIYIGHVGDSGIVLGYQESESANWLARPLTKDHKPESAGEIQRIKQCGGKVVIKSGVPRVVWNRPRLDHQGIIERSTPFDEIPLLAVARSLGDLWSYNLQLDKFVVSPVPHCTVIPIDTNTFRCLIFGTDGLYNMLSPQRVVHIVQQAEKHNENAALSDDHNKVWMNPSKCLVDKAFERWSMTKFVADNTSVITLICDPSGSPRAQVLQNRKRKMYPDSALEILTRYKGEIPTSPKRACMGGIQTSCKQLDNNVQINFFEKVAKGNIFTASDMLRKTSVEYSLRTYKILDTIIQQKHSNSRISTEVIERPVCDISINIADIDKNFMPKTRESTSFDSRDPDDLYTERVKSNEKVQINEINSSCSNTDMLDDLQMDRPELKSKKSESLIKKHAEVNKRLVLHNRNLKNSVENKVVKPKRNQEVETESSIISSRQLRFRTSMQQVGKVCEQDQNGNESFVMLPQPSTSSGTKFEWLRAKGLNSKKVKKRTKTRGRLKEAERVDDSMRRSSGRSSMVQSTSESLKKVLKKDQVVKQGRGQPPGKKTGLRSGRAAH